MNHSQSRQSRRSVALLAVSRKRSPCVSSESPVQSLIHGNSWRSFNRNLVMGTRRPHLSLPGDKGTLLSNRNRAPPDIHHNGQPSPVPLEPGSPWTLGDCTNSHRSRSLETTQITQPGAHSSVRKPAGIPLRESPASDHPTDPILCPFLGFNASETKNPPSLLSPWIS